MATTYISISERVTKAEAGEITLALKEGDAVVCHAICLTRDGRKTMLRHLLRAGVPASLAPRCGWATAAPRRDVAPTPEPAPQPTLFDPEPETKRKAGRGRRPKVDASS